MKLTPTQERTLRTVKSMGGTVDGWAGIKGLNLNSLSALARRGLVEDLGSTKSEDGSHFVTYNRHRLTQAGLEWLSQ